MFALLLTSLDCPNIAFWLLLWDTLERPLTIVFWFLITVLLFPVVNDWIDSFILLDKPLTALLNVLLLTSLDSPKITFRLLSCDLLSKPFIIELSEFFILLLLPVINVCFIALALFDNPLTILL